MVFSGTLDSDYLKLVNIPDNKKSDLLNYAATDFLSLRDSLVKYIKAVYPLEYQNFSESDLGVMLIESVCYMGAVLSMKADMLANENILSLAKNRNNVKNLLEIIGVRMKGPVGAMANAKITLDSPSTSTEIVLSPQDRVVTIASPEDSGPLNYTIYKVTGGDLESPNPNSELTFSVNESDSFTSSVWTNVVLLEGSLVTQNGTFNTNDVVKKITLGVSPIIQNSVEVYINADSLDASGAWKLVDNIYSSSGGGDNIFEVVYDDNYAATVIFGDGNIGRTAPNGASYTVTYRVGGGTRGNIANEVINASISFDGGQTGRIENISQATGGRDAESVEHAKRYAPLTFKRQDRLVTAEDYSTFANSFVGTTGSSGKAKAVVRDAYSSANIIDLYLLQVASNIQLQQATVAYKKELLEAMNDKKMLTDEVVIVDGLVRTVDLSITARIDKKLLPNEERVKGRIRNKVLEFFSVDSFDFGKTLVLADLSRTIFSLPEVRYATIDNFDADVQVDFHEIIQINNLVINIVGI